MQDLTGRAARRLYEVSRNLYAPVLAAFAVEWLDDLVGHAAFNAAFPGAESRAAGRQSIPGLFAA